MTIYCDMPGCTQRATIFNAWGCSNRCYDHICLCDNDEADNDRAVCTVHLCSEPSCTRTKQGWGTSSPKLFCGPGHQCQWQSNRNEYWECRNWSIDNTDFCLDHMDPTAVCVDCGEQPVDESSFVARSHRVCEQCEVDLRDYFESRDQE